MFASHRDACNEGACVLQISKSNKKQGNKKHSKGTLSNRDLLVLDWCWADDLAEVYTLVKSLIDSTQVSSSRITSRHRWV